MSAEHTISSFLNVLVVGCGNIAGGFDVDRPSNNFPYTHAGAYARDGRFNLAACVEPNDQRLDEFMKTWSVPLGYRSIPELLDRDASFDVISICSPTACHAHDIDLALRLKPRVIFCEKPITTTLQETEQLVAACSAARIPLAVNYTRRWDPDILALQTAIRTGHWGKLRSITGLYNKGILNNGSHMIDLLHFLVGRMEIIQVGQPVEDYSASDPSVPVWLEGYQGVPIHLACGRDEDYALFELQLVFSLGILTMEEGGMYWRERRAVASNIFKGYRTLDAGLRRAGEYPKAMTLAVNNIHRAIKHGDELASTGETALEAQRVCEQIRQQACSM